MAKGSQITSVQLELASRLHMYGLMEKVFVMPGAGFATNSIFSQCTGMSGIVVTGVLKEQEEKKEIDSNRSNWGSRISSKAEYEV